MDPKTMPNRRCKCEDKSHEKCPVVHGTDHCTVHLGSIISQSIEKVTFYSYFDYLCLAHFILVTLFFFVFWSL